MVAPREIVWVSAYKLRPNKRNSRTHSKTQIGQIANSVLRFGWTYPILVDEKNAILAGHARCLVAQQLGYRKVPVIVVSGLSDAEKRALAIADNKIASNAGWDRRLLAEEMGELAEMLPECNLDLEITGFELPEIDRLLGDDLTVAEPGRIDIPPPAKPVTLKKTKAISRTGDVWQLGPHKILCGAALSANDVLRFVDSKAAAIIIMGPPCSLPNKRIKGVGDYSEDMTAAQFTHFVRDSLSHGTKRSLSDAMHFVVVDWPHLRREIGAGSVLPPLCADAAVRCWQAHTKRSAILQTTGQSFDAVAAVRGKSGGAS